MKGEFHARIQDLMGQSYFQGENIERRILCTYSGCDKSDLFLRRENCNENLIELLRT